MKIYKTRMIHGKWHVQLWENGKHARSFSPVTWPDVAPLEAAAREAGYAKEQ